MSPEDKTIPLVESVLETAYRGSLQMFLDLVWIEARGEKRRFKDVRDPWQQERILSPLVPALEKVAGVRQEYRGPYWFQFYVPAGHAKTTVMALLASWGLLYAKHSFTGVCAARDSNQAQEVRKAMGEIAKLNQDVFKKRLKIYKQNVQGPCGDMEVISSDSSSSYGKLVHLYILDEFTKWGDNEKLYESLIYGVDKRGPDSAVFVIISNAGYTGSWQEEKKEIALSMPQYWHVWEAPGHLASWMSLDTQKAKKAQLTPGEARRIYDNVWVSPSEAGDLATPQEIKACEDLGRQLGLTQIYSARIDARHVGAIDYGVTRDHAVACICHRDEALDVIVVDQMRVWAAFQYPGGRVLVEDVEEWIATAHRNFHLRALSIDKYEMESTIQKFESRMPVERFETRGGKGNYELAVHLRKLLVNRQLAWYEGCGLLKHPSGREDTLSTELGAVSLRLTDYGFRIDNVRAGVHDDRVTCLAMAALCLTERVPRQTNLMMSTVVRHKTDRNLYGIPRQDVGEVQRLYDEVHRTKKPRSSAAERRGLYGRGRR